MIRLFFVLAAVALATPSLAQSFSCSIGSQPACLDYGEKVCSSNGKCVTSDAVCFNSYTCNFEGFVCKSDMDELAEKAKRMAQGYDELRQCLSHSSDMSDVAECVRKDNFNIY
jgi:hypothetical protein